MMLAYPSTYDIDELMYKSSLGYRFQDNQVLAKRHMNFKCAFVSVIEGRPISFLFIIKICPFQFM